MMFMSAPLHSEHCMMGRTQLTVIDVKCLTLDNGQKMHVHMTEPQEIVGYSKTFFCVFCTVLQTCSLYTYIGKKQTRFRPMQNKLN